MLDVASSFLANQAMNYLVSGKAPRRTGNAHPNIQPQDVFASRDGYLVLVVGNDGQFAKFCEVLGRPEWARDERFATNAGRVRNTRCSTPLIAELLAARERDRLDARMRSAPACRAARSTPCREVFEDPQVQARGMLVDIAHPLAGAVPQVASPMRFTDAPLVARARAAAARRAHRRDPARARLAMRRRTPPPEGAA